MMPSVSSAPTISTQPSMMPSMSSAPTISTQPSMMPSESGEPSSQPSTMPSVSGEPSSQPSNTPTIDCTQEGEVCRSATSAPDTVNGGCVRPGVNFPETFFSIDIAIGETICGITSTIPSFGDEDWFTFTVETNRTVSATLNADFPAEFFLYKGNFSKEDCPLNASLVDSDSRGDGNSNYKISATLLPGDDYALVVLPSVASGLECGINQGSYTLTLMSQPTGTPTSSPSSQPTGQVR